ncbi:MBL fold metallo-hydrolase [Halomicroarcula sp. F28]|uniref:MBL fold metallo-hydrolase n=1 Tax=Haloarcula salinisoli TaxID=2487746 RepID=UPI001C73B7F2|nr:MBL fold metallo-hydrolase [Halomicroarcula salinisoli]MBX0286157.1 MBL fold metallo-hydrolase [Halomicroarcula salinisoli]
MDWRRVNVAVESRAPTGETAAYLSEGPDALLVDPADRTPALDDAVSAADVAHVAVTHHHPDHVGAVADYARETSATVWARRGRTESFESATGIAPDRTFAEGTTVPAGDDGVEVLDLPGHAPEHVGFATESGVVSGDVAVAEGSVVVGAPEGDMRAYLSSLRRLHSRNPDALYPGHGPTIDEPRSSCRRLLRHRRGREERVREAVAAGAATPEEILDRAYEKDLSGVRDLALATVVAHLEKLAVEGSLRWDGNQALPARASRR